MPDSESAAASEATLPEGWIKRESKSRPGTYYYFAESTGETTWHAPTEPPAGGKRKRGGDTASAAERMKQKMRAQLADDGEKVHVLHLLCKHAGSRNPSSWREQTVTRTKDEAIARLSELRATIAASDDVEATFRELASHESDCRSAREGGSLGFFGRGKMQKPFEAASFRLEVKDLSGVVDTDSGVHIILRIA